MVFLNIYNCAYKTPFCKSSHNYCEQLTPVFWVFSLRFPSFLKAYTLLLVQCYSMLSAAAVYGNSMCYSYSSLSLVILGTAESTMLWV